MWAFTLSVFRLLSELYQCDPSMAKSIPWVTAFFSNRYKCIFWRRSYLFSAASASINEMQKIGSGAMAQALTGSRLKRPSPGIKARQKCWENGSGWGCAPSCASPVTDLFNVRFNKQPPAWLTGLHDPSPKFHDSVAPARPTRQSRRRGWQNALPTLLSNSLFFWKGDVLQKKTLVASVLRDVSAVSQTSASLPPTRAAPLQLASLFTYLE